MIGVKKCIIVVDLGGMALEMFNPRIVSKSVAYEAVEGCLSLYGARSVTRYRNIKVEWKTRAFQTKTQTFTGNIAQIIQHENRVKMEFRDIKQERPTYDELVSWHRASGLPLRRFFNTSGTLYKSMNLKEKLPDMSEEEQLRLLATDGMLVKRPILVGEGFVLVGFKQDEWESKAK